MHISLISVGTKMSSWIQEGVEEYRKRISGPLGFSLVEIPLPRRGKSASVSECVKKEGEAILAKIRQYDHVVALEVSGKRLSTVDVAKRLKDFKAMGQDVIILAGGPDGLHSACRDRANEQWSLSDLTLPHPLVRVLLVEQLYRANSLLQGHPYHR